MTIMTALILLAILGTVLSLMFGVSTMATGHEIAHRSAEQWMFMRVGFQAAAVLLLVLALFVK